MSILQNARRWLAEALFGEEIERLANEQAIEAVEEERRWRGMDYYRAQVEFIDSPEGRRMLEAIQRAGKLTEAETIAQLRDEDKTWRSLSSTRFEIPFHKLENLQSQARYLYYRHPLARNIIRNYVFLVCGRGCKMQFNNARDQATWDEWARRANWKRRHKDIVKNTVTYGEYPVVLFPLTEDTQISSGGEEPDVPRRGKNAPVQNVRGFDPREIIDVATNPDDREQFTALKRSQSRPGGEVWKYVYSGEDFVYFGLDQLGSSVRGRPLLEPVVRPLRWIDSFLLDRVILNGIRNRLPIIRKLAVSGKRAAAEGGKLTNLPRPATVLTVGAGEEWEFPRMNIEGGDAAPDVRNILLYISAGVNLPEFLVTSNAQTANKSSLQEATDQMQPMIEDLQATFGDGFADIAEKVVGTRPEAVWAKPERSDFGEKVQAYSRAHADKVMSLRTYAARLGLDWDEEVKLQAEEQEILRAEGLQSIFPAFQFGQDNRADDEDDDAAAGDEDDAADDGGGDDEG